MNSDKNTTGFDDDNKAGTGDKYLYASFILFGLAQLLPWNIYSKSIPYFCKRLTDPSYGKDIAGYMTSSFTTFNLVTMLSLVILRWDELFLGTHQRITIGMTGSAILMLIMAILISIDVSQNVLFVSLICITAMAGSLTSWMMKGLLGMVAGFPPYLTPALLGGQAASGLLASLTNFLTTLFSAQNKELGATGPTIYFSVGTGILALAQIVFLANCRWSKFFRRCLGLSNTKPQTSRRAPFSVVWAVLLRIKWLALGVLLTLGVTISIYISFIVSPRRALENDKEGILGTYYVPVIFIIYDLGDLIGRWSPSISLFASHPRSWLVKSCSWLRALVFIPLFILLAPVEVGNHGIEPIIGPAIDASLGINDYLYAALALGFGITNGYCCTLSLMHAPSLAVSTKSSPMVIDSSTEFDPSWEPSSCGSLMGLFLNVGITLGSLSSFIWKAIF